MSNLIKSAKEYQNKQQWEKAIGLYEKYLLENKGDEEVYLLYAECHMQLRNIPRVKELLLEAKSLFPKNEEILSKITHTYFLLNENHNALINAQELVDMNNTNPRNYFLLGKAYSLTGETDKAKVNFEKGLEHQHHMPFNELLKKIQQGFSENPEEVHTEYVFIKGKNNYGSLLHTYRREKYFTKIFKKNKRSQREETFYKELSQKFPLLKKHIPNYIDSQVLDNILYLTMEMVEGVTPDLESEHMKDVIKASQKITAIPYKKIPKKYSPQLASFYLKNVPNPVVIFFTQIHQASYNEKLFSSLYKLLDQHNYPKSVIPVIQQLEQLILENRLYTFIHPEMHYSFIHGDFNRSNLKVDQKDQTIKVFDWDLFKTGPHFLDIARFLSSSFVPYDEVKKIYLNDEALGGKLSIIEKIFFLYALILLYLLTIREQRIDESLDIYMTPALHDLEAFVFEFIESEHYRTVQSLRKAIKKDKTKISQLENKVSKLESKVKKMKKQHKKIVGSKSWKMTAPIRKFTQILKRKR